MNKKPDNIVAEKKKSFDDFDKLNLKSFAENLLQNMEKGTASSIGEQGAYTVSLNAEFGNGKTTFLEMFKYFIEEDKKDKNYDVISINAWKSDFYREPIISILSEFVNLIKTQDSKNDKKGNTINKEKTIKKITKIIGNVANHKATRLIGNVANQVIDKNIGLNIKEIATSCGNKNTEKTKVDNEAIGQNILEELNQRKSTIEEIKSTISGYTKDKRLIIIVDELDRTRPDYAVHFLEDMKHFFDIKNVIFLVAVNRKQISATVKCLYGQELDFEGYYRKFFKQEIDLPDPYKEAQNLINDLIKKTKVKYIPDNRRYGINNYHLAFKIFELTLRELETSIRIFENVLGSNVYTTTWMYLNCYPFFICLYMKNKKIFKQILDENFFIDAFLRFIDEKGFKQKYQHESNTEKRQEKHDINYLLAQVSCSFIKDQNQISEYNGKIVEKFPETPNSDVNSFFQYSGPSGLVEGFTLNKGQPALNICKNINQHESVFKE